MHAMSTPYIQIRDPDDLELSDEDGKSESSAETIGSPCATGDVVALISRSYEDDKEQQAIISDQSRLRILGWMIANTSATIGSVRSGALPTCKSNRITRLQLCRSSSINCSSIHQRSNMTSSALQHIISPLQASCSACFRGPRSVTSRQEESRPWKYCRSLYRGP